MNPILLIVHRPFDLVDVLVGELEVRRRRGSGRPGRAGGSRRSRRRRPDCARSRRRRPRPGVVSCRSATAVRRSTSARCCESCGSLEAGVVLAPVVVGHGSQCALGSSGRSAARSPSASRRSPRSPPARRTGGSRARRLARSASTAAAASRPARSAGSGAAARGSKLETPMCRTRPCSLSSASAAQPSSMSASGIGQWIW